jgi:hypothetical protein
MNPMDDAKLDRLIAQAKKSGKRGRKAKRRLTQLIESRVRRAERAILLAGQRAVVKTPKPPKSSWFVPRVYSDETHLACDYARNDTKATWDIWYAHPRGGRG